MSLWHQEPRYIPGWQTLIGLYAAGAQWRYVDVGCTKALAQVSGLHERFGTAYGRVTADLLCAQAQAVSDKEACWRAALRACPAHVGAKEALALWYDAQGNARLALAEVQSMDAATRRASASLCVLEARLLVAEKQPARAVVLLSSVESHFAAHAPLHYWLGRALWESDRRGRDDCKRQLLVAARLEPTHGATFAALGEWFEAAGDVERARRCHSRAFALDTALLPSALFVSECLTEVDPVAAAKLHSRVLEAWPVCKWAAQRLGAHFLAVGRAENALSAFQSCLRADNTECAAWDGLGDAYRAQGKFFASISAYNQSIEHNGGRYYPFYRSGSVMRELGTPAEALARLERAYALRPDSVPVQHEMVLSRIALAERFARSGLPHRGSEELVLALPMAQSVAQRTQHSKPVVDVALLAVKLLFSEHAARESLVALSVQASLASTSSPLDRAVCAFHAGAPDALQHLARAPATYENLLGAGVILLRQRQLAAAHRCFVDAAALDPRSSKPLLLLGVLYIVGGRPALAQRAYARAVALEPDLPEAWAGQGVLNELLGGPQRVAEARMLYGSVAAMRADMFEANVGLGRVALAGGDAFQAELGLRRALARRPTNLDARYLLALAFESQGRHALAEDVLRGVLAQLDADHGAAPSPSSDVASTLVMSAADAWTPAQKRRVVVAALARVLVKLHRWGDARALLDTLTQPTHHEMALSAFVAWQLGEGDRSVALFVKAHALAPPKSADAVHAQEQLCRALVAMGRTAEAVGVARELLFVNPALLAALGARLGDAALLREATAPAVTWRVAGARHGWQARAAQIAGRHDEAMSHLQRAIRADPSRASAWAALAAFAKEHHATGLFRVARMAGGQAQAYLLSAVGKYPGESSIALADQVRAAVQRRLHSDPSSAAAWTSLAWVEYTHAHLTGEAESWRYARSLLQAAPASVDVSCAVSECHLRLRDPAAAAAVLPPVELSGAVALRAHARLLLYAGHAKAAMGLYARAVKADPAYGEAWVEMSDLFVQARNFDAARHCLASVPRPDSLTNSLRQLMLLLAARKDDEAKQLAVRLHPMLPRDSFGANLVVGHLELKLNSVKAATRRLTRAAESDPSAPVVHELLALCKKGDAAAMTAQLQQDMNAGDALPAMRALWRIDSDKAMLQRCIRLDPSQAMLWKDLEKLKA